MISSLELDSPLRKLASVYLNVKQFIIDKGYALEIDWQEEIRYENISETDFLREAAWVILSSGMRESVIRKKFNQISKIFFYWKSAQKIYEQSHRCKREALLYFNNPRKIDAIIQIANHVYERGFYKVKEAIRREDIDYIIKLPYMGPAVVSLPH